MNSNLELIMSVESPTAKDYSWHIYKLEGRDPNPEATEEITIYLAAVRTSSTERAELEGRRYLSAWKATHSNNVYIQALEFDSNKRNPLDDKYYDDLPEAGFVETRVGYDPIRNTHYFLFRVKNDTTFMASQEVIPGTQECF